MELIDYLESLCPLDGISGDEGDVREYIISCIDGMRKSGVFDGEYQTDSLGNLIVYKKGSETPEKKLLISAHMDEVGLIITYINSDGTLKFDTVGGIDTRVLYGRRVYIGRDKVLGVIGGKAIHNLTDEEREKAPSVSEMTIDIGVTSRESAGKLVSLGDSVVFDSQFLRFGDGMIKAKAIDDRAGCAVMLKLLGERLKYDTWFSFVVQEEVGLRGSGAAAFAVSPDYAIVLEATTASDIPSSANEKRVCEVGKGPVVSFMDRRTIYDRELYKLAFDTAEKLGIPCQTKTAIAGGNDAGAISISGRGVRTAAISLPCRYLHSPSCVIAYKDMQDTYMLTKNLSERILKK